MIEEVFARAARLRRPALPHRLPRLRAGAPAGGPARHDDARAARLRPSCEPLFRTLRRGAADLDLRRAARAAARRANWIGHRVSRPARRISTRLRAGHERLPRVRRADLAGEARRSRDRDRATARHAAEDRRQGRRQRTATTSRTRSSRCSPIRWSNSWARSARTRRTAFLGGAAALLFPIDWPEPFGLVMIEAMACGTPVVAFRRGSVPEVMRDGVSGFVVDDDRRRRWPRTARAVELPRDGRPRLLRASASRRRGWRRITSRSSRRWSDSARRPAARRRPRGVRAGGDRRRRPTSTAGTPSTGWAAKRV